MMISAKYSPEGFLKSNAGELVKLLDLYARFNEVPRNQKNLTYAFRHYITS